MAALMPPMFSPQNTNEATTRLPPMFSPQNTNDSIDMDALCNGLLGNEAPPAASPPEVAPPQECPEAAAEPEFDEERGEEEGNTCWGGLLKDDKSCCTPGFVTGKAHFKNKFCVNCRKGIEVPAARVRAMAPEMRYVYQNSLRTGVRRRRRAPPSLAFARRPLSPSAPAC
jgi:hypothetical protein